MGNGDLSTKLSTHYALVADAIVRGRVVPFLGAGVNLCERPATFVWDPKNPEYLPNGRELAGYLAKEFRYPAAPCSVNGCPKPAPELDLARVSQHGATLLQDGPVNEQLRAVFAQSFRPTAVHSFLAGLRAPRAQTPYDKHLLVVTTNYDDLMEQAFGEDNFDLVFYALTGRGSERKGRFWHKAPGASPQPIPDSSSYPYEFFKDRPVILKVHGTIDRTNEDGGSFVITEDHYIEYISAEPMERLLPPRLLQKMRVKHHLLFLGYSLRDWNFRVFLRRLKQSEYEPYMPWAVLLNADDTECKFWEKNDVEIIDSDLKTYIEGLQRGLLDGQKAQR